MVPRVALFAVGLALPLTDASAADAIEEITVTARHKAERLLDVPQTMSVLDRSSLDRRQIRAAIDVAGMVPGVQVAQPLGESFPVFVVRGVGLQDYNLNNSPAVAIYLDDVYLSSNAMIPPLFAGLDRIEVLKGPKGTLYGRNATGGAVRLITADRPAQGHGVVTLGVGNYATVEADGVVGAEIDDRSSVMAQLGTVQRFDGYQFNRRTGSSHGEAHRWNGVLTYTNRLTDDVPFRGKLYSGLDRSDTAHFQHRGAVGANCQVIARGVYEPQQCTDAFGYADRDNDKLAGDYNRDPRMRDHNVLASARFDVDVGDWAIASITAVADYTYDHTQEEDAGPQVAVQIDYDNHITQQTQEFRIVGPLTDAVEVTAGAFAGRFVFRNDRLMRFGDFESRFGPIFGTSQAAMPYRQVTRSMAAFAAADWAATDTVSFNAGLRLTGERITYRGGLEFPLLRVKAVNVDNRIKDTDLSGDVGVSWRPDADTLAYARIARGFKAGGFFGGFAVSPAELAGYGKETIIATEIGLKREWPDAGVTLAVAGFNYDYDGLQGQAPNSIGSGAITIPRLRNFPGAQVRGLEAEATLRVSDRASLNATVGLTDSSLRGPMFVFGSGGAAGPRIELSGNKLPRTPGVTAAMAASASQPLRSGWALEGSISAGVGGRSHIDLANLPMSVQPTFATVDAQLSLVSPDGRRRIEAWVKNATDYLPLLGDA